MKKVLLAALFITMVMGVNAQDGFFRSDSGDDNGTRTSSISGTLPALPGGGVGKQDKDQTAPLGSGLLVLTALGAGYAISRKNTRRGE